MPIKKMYLRNDGGFANRMFRYMFACHLRSRIENIDIAGVNLPEWGLVSEEQEIPYGNSIATGPVHVVNIDKIVANANSSDVVWLDIDCFAMRLEYFAYNRQWFKKIFSSGSGKEVADDEIAIHIRTGDILDGIHPDYTPIPISCYQDIVRNTGLKPVFIGQVGRNWYTDALREQFPSARFLCNDILTDFQTIRQAKNIMIAVSSFSWLAAFLSSSARQIHMPLAGFLNPKQRPDVNLVPMMDERYSFHAFPSEQYTASTIQTAILKSNASKVRPTDKSDGHSYMGLQLKMS